MTEALESDGFGEGAGDWNRQRLPDGSALRRWRPASFPSSVTQSFPRKRAGRLAELGCSNVRLEIGDGTRGWPEEAPYDRILVTAAAEVCPPALLDQLAEGGVLLMPLGGPGDQELVRWEKRGGKLERQSLGGCRFVPLVGDSPAEE